MRKEKKYTSTTLIEEKKARISFYTSIMALITSIIALIVRLTK